MSTKFKIGDKVRCIDPQMFKHLNLRDIHEVKYADGTYLTIEINNYPYTHFAFRFELVKETEMKKDYDMNKQPWFIKIGGEVEYNLVQAFLLDNIGKKCPRAYGSNIKYLTNVRQSSGVGHDILWCEDKPEKRGIEEIKITYEIERVNFPEVVTPQEKEIAKIEEEMRSLADRLNKLKGV